MYVYGMKIWEKQNRILKKEKKTKAWRGTIVYVWLCSLASYHTSSETSAIHPKVFII